MADGGKPKVRERASLLMKAVLEALDAAGGSMRLRDIMAEVPNRVVLTPFDLEVYVKSGYLRWKSLIHFFSIDFAKAGFIRKHSGQWHLTPEGRALLQSPADEILEKATRAYRQWRAAQPDIEHTEEAISSVPPMDAAPELAASSTESVKRSFVLETAEDEARSEIEDFIKALGPYDVQEIVAALLRGMGYTTPFVAPLGPDGGTDILAYPDPLGAKTPHIRVQVKHRASEKAKREEIAALRGIIRQDREIGLFVSTSGFTSDARREARTGTTHIELMELEQLLSQWSAVYERLTEEDKSLLRLRRVYFLAPD